MQEPEDTTNPAPRTLTRFGIIDPSDMRVRAVVEAENEEQALRRFAVIARLVGYGHDVPGAYVSVQVILPGTPLPASFFADSYFIMLETRSAKKH